MAVGVDNVNELLGQVVLRTLVIVLEHRGADLRRGDGQHRAHHPIGAAPHAAEAHEIHVLVADAAEKAVYVLRLQEAAHILGLIWRTLGARHGNPLPLSHDATQRLVVITMGLTRTTTVLCLLTAAGHLLTGREYRLPAILALEAADGLGGLLVDEELGALHADATQHLE